MHSKTKGFTLIELMVTLAVLAIVIFIAFPSFNYVITKAKYESAVTELVRGLEYARQQAMLRETYSRFCMINEQHTGCSPIIELAHREDESTQMHWGVQVINKENNTWETIRVGTFKVSHFIDFIGFSNSESSYPAVGFSPQGRNFLRSIPQGTAVVIADTYIELIPFDYLLSGAKAAGVKDYIRIGANGDIQYIKNRG